LTLKDEGVSMTSRSRITARQIREDPAMFRIGLIGLSTAAALMFSAAAPVGAQTSYRQSPLLDAEVGAGRLPPVKERLPATPRVIDNPVGVYGGTLRSGTRERTDSWPRRVIGMENLVLMDREWSKPVPNVAESWAANADLSEFTFRLRAGMRWSDGQPFTADDIMFAAEHVYTNPKLGGVPGFLRSKEGAGKVEKLGAHEIKVTFKGSNGLFLDQLATLNAETFTQYPAHYLKQFHKTFTPNVEAAAKAAGFDDWTEYFTSRAAWMENPDLPVIFAWRITEPFGKGALMQAVRNPWYWQVDKAGNQLPYIDRIAFTVFQEPQVLLLKAIAGELDLHARHINETANKAVLFDNQRRGNYRLFDLSPESANAISLSFNQTYPKDKAKAELLQNRDFRVGVSHAINRQAIADVVFIGQCEPAQTAALPDYPPLFSERLARQYTEFSREKANAALDKAGLGARDAQGRRLAQDGRPVEIGLTIRTDKPAMIDAMDMARRDLAAVGVTARLEVIDRTLLRTRRATADFEVMVDDYSGATQDIFLGARWLLPLDAAAAYGVGWSQWYAKRPNAVEPPASVRRQLALWEEINATAAQEKRISLMREIIDIAADNFFDLGICQERSWYGIVSNRLRNVPDRMIGSFQQGHPKPAMPASFYFAGGAR
jgi:peptide/nickel transport system substrate-binding protein